MRHPECQFSHLFLNLLGALAVRNYPRSTGVEQIHRGIPKFWQDSLRECNATAEYREASLEQAEVTSKDTDVNPLFTTETP